MKDSKSRFSDRVDNYSKYRPHYPVDVISILSAKINLNTHWIIADIGSGMGFSSEHFLDNGNIVFGVEPNKEMREAAEKYLHDKAGFISINGSAEDTTLDNDSIDLIVVGQALHWFDLDKARLEFKRILKNRCYVAMIWNERKSGDSPFLIEYESLLKKYCNDYGKATQKNFTINTFNGFYGPGNFKIETLSNFQMFDFEGLKGRLQSSSYSPNENEAHYTGMIEELKLLFDKYKKDRLVKFEYETKLYYGTIV